MVVFVLFWAVPNVDPSYWLGGAEKGTNETRARAVEKYGLDDPLPVQYLHLMEGIVSGDVECFYGCGNLREAFVQALPVTISLVVGAGLIAVGLGLWLGMVCVRHRGRWPDRVISAAATAAYSVPSIVLASLLWAFLSYKWNIFPLGRLRAAHRRPDRVGVASLPAVGRRLAAVRRRLRPLRAGVAPERRGRGLGAGRLARRGCPSGASSAATSCETA